ncbi:hypothetical protein HPB47_004193 [Ixodes persulcatus]|uniref:Uncharacterized protein n=1 Tax=Ixodes persulcatus TaxID=34615 RepID=A0AC60PGJ0_IXOPE|nr:hypothetical protein HPB47_004193 [Ixodes persulcatus]
MILVSNCVYWKNRGPQQGTAVKRAVDTERPPTESLRGIASGVCSKGTTSKQQCRGQIASQSRTRERQIDDTQRCTDGRFLPRTNKHREPCGSTSKRSVPGGSEAGEMASWQKQQKELHQQQRDLEQQQQRRLQQQLASTHVLRQSSTEGVPVPNQVHVPPAATTPNVWSPRGAPPQSAANVSRDTRHQHPPSKAPPPVHPRPARLQVQTAQPVMQPPPQMQQTSPQMQRHMQPSPKMPSSPQMQRMQPMQQQQPNQPTQTMTTVTTTRRVPLDVVPQPSGQRVWTEQPVSEYQDPGGPSTAQVIAAQSQDYVDEKELEYRMAIQQLQVVRVGRRTGKPEELRRRTMRHSSSTLPAAIREFLRLPLNVRSPLPTNRTESKELSRVYGASLASS